MIYTVFSPPAWQADRFWQSQLVASSWVQARQPGELVQLSSEPVSDRGRCHSSARVYGTQSWSPHPFMQDTYHPYQTAAGVLEWLFLERIEGTVLLLGPTTALLNPVTEQVKAGQARARAWADMPRGDGPFGLSASFAFLSECCVDRELALPAVQLPVLIHSSDLRKVAPRWLELMAIIRAETARESGPFQDADKLAYAIAAAEVRVPHAPVDLGTFDLRGTIRAADQTVLWDGAAYRAWDPIQPDAAAPGPERAFLGLVAVLRERHAGGSAASFLRPFHQRGVREGRILGSMFLEVPGREDTVSLNSSGIAIWEACDGTRSLADINRELEARFEMPPGSLVADIDVVIKRLERIGALGLAQ